MEKKETNSKTPGKNKDNNKEEKNIFRKIIDWLIEII